MFQGIKSQSSGISRGRVTEAIGDKAVGKLMEGECKKQWWGKNDQLCNKMVHCTFNK
jgi:hypothetical protein